VILKTLSLRWNKLMFWYMETLSDPENSGSNPTVRKHPDRFPPLPTNFYPENFFLRKVWEFFYIGVSIY
jgi:hypothetical protein